MNPLTAPEDFTNPFWSKTQATIDSNVIAAPDGTTTGDRIVSSGSGASSATDASHVLAAAGQSCINVFAKADVVNWLAIGVLNYDPANGTSYFDLANGVVGTKFSGHDSISVELINGWYRCTVVLTTTTDLDGAIRFYPSPSDGSVTTALNDSIFLWGAYTNSGASPVPYVSEAGITVPSSSARIIRNVTRDVTSNVTKNLIDF